MESAVISRVCEAVSHIESHLSQGVTPAGAARAAHYSPCYMHRLFLEAAGVTPHRYIHRRRLTEAARQLVYTRRPVLQIALDAGYESQQAFSAAFAPMYKAPPAAFRRAGAFYPLQLPLCLRPDARPFSGQRARPARAEDIPAWMALLRQVVDGHPRLDEAEHLAWLMGRIARGEALILKSGDAAAGAVGFCSATGRIDFLGVHPQFRAQGASERLLEAVRAACPAARELCLTTFRERDPADPGMRREWLRLGFEPAELLWEFGYPTQRMVLPAARLP